MRLKITNIIFFFSFHFVALAQDSPCLDCHSDNSLTMERKNKTISIFVDKEKFSKSIHSSLECSDCHDGFDAENIPHKDGNEIYKVDCGRCHEEHTTNFKNNIHEKLPTKNKITPNCITCHKKHEIISPSVVKNKEKYYCSTCHEDKKIVNTFHKLTANKRNDCNTCHKDSNHIKNKLSNSPHKNLNCYDCHSCVTENFNDHLKTIPASQKADCKNCHTDILKKHNINYGFTQEEIKNNSALCWDCHGNHEVSFVENFINNVHQKDKKSKCEKCHKNVEQKYLKSSHGIALSKGEKNAPKCITCHEHEITSNKDLNRKKINQEKLCLSCHLENPDILSKTSTTASFISSYENSVHSIGLKNGGEKSATCVDCHGSHETLKGFEKNSLVSRENQIKTCGKCHNKISQDFEKSIHGVAVNKGIKESPICTDCHGEHDILKRTDPKAKISKSNVATEVCSPCHSSVKITQKYGLAKNKVETFSDSFHGLASVAGNIEVANCASCHGVHNIKPSSDSTSTISPKNLAATCGNCHPGANKQFTIGKVHSTSTSKDEPLLYWIATIYVLLIIVTIGGMFIHNIFDFIKKSQHILKIKRGLITPKTNSTKLYIRMSLNERLQHGFLFTSFITLVLTGFALKYPNAWWVKPIEDISPIIFEIRSLLHRIAAVVMTAVSLYHLYYILFTSNGKKLIHDLMPVKKDFFDFIDMVKYFLGKKHEKPKFDRFGYIEKAEYWALIWGTIVMCVTGIILWFDNTFMGILTKLGWDAARLIHFYEAWLATLAIIVWHFYFVIFNPDVYPMNVAWWKGTITESEMEEEHPLELEKLKEKNKS